MTEEAVVERADVDAILRGIFDVNWRLEEIRRLLGGDDEAEEEANS